MSVVKLRTLLLCGFIGLGLAGCDRQGVVKPEKESPKTGERATQTGTLGSLAGTSCTAASECGPGLDCDLSKGPRSGVCVERANPQSTPPQTPSGR
jgi:hypothetical protein